MEEREAIWQDLLQVKTHRCSDPAISLLGVLSTGTKVSEWKTSHRTLITAACIAGWHSYVNTVLGGGCNTMALTETRVVAKNGRSGHSLLVDKHLSAQGPHIPWNVGQSLKGMSWIYTDWLRGISGYIKEKKGKEWRDVYSKDSVFVK